MGTSLCEGIPLRWYRNTHLDLRAGDCMAVLSSRISFKVRSEPFQDSAEINSHRPALEFHLAVHDMVETVLGDERAPNTLSRFQIA